MSNMTRRQMLKGFALGSIVAASSGLATGCAPSSPLSDAGNANGTEKVYQFAKRTSEVSDRIPVETDVLVIGGGGAGVCAALAAAEEGACVAICEKTSMFGGATALSSGKIPAVGTAQQKEKEDSDSIGACAMDIMRPSNYSVRPDLVYTAVEHSRDIVEWTEGFGAVWTVDDALYFGQTAYRMHTTDGEGEGLMDALIASLEAEAAIEPMLSCEIMGLILEDEADVVVGAWGKKGSEDIAIFAGNTVLATSGFANNPDMLERYCPEATVAVKVVAPGATGEGILWGEELGASLQNMGAYQGHAFHGVDNDKTLEQGVANNGGIIVNRDGNRFMNEYGGYSEMSPHVLAQPDGIGYLVFTDVQRELSRKYPEWEEAGIVAVAPSAGELADLIGISRDKFERTVADYQKALEVGMDKFNRAHLPATFEGPYYAVKLTGEIRHTQGGVATDVAGHVLREDGTLIDGLYAAGGCTEGFSSRGGAAYMSGNGLIQALVFGKIAGIAAATEQRGEAKVAVWEKTGIDDYL